MKMRLLSASLALAAAVSAAVTLTAQSPQPGMPEAKALIERELSRAGDFSVISTYKGTASEKKRVVKKVSLSDCRLSVEHTYQPFFDSSPGLVMTYVDTVSLKDIDVSKVRTIEGTVGTGETRNRPTYYIPLRALVQGEEPFSVQSEGGGNPRKVTARGAVSLNLADASSGERIAAAVRQAAVLCGAPDRPVETPPTPVASATAGSSKLTNADVIKMVEGGLSEQVVATAVRQAAVKEFDLSPMALIDLKKAGVPDVVIAAMQEKPAPAPPAPPKYDPNLRTTPPAASTPTDTCAGVESLGLFKNDTGLGVVEWLGKIRNNGSMTRIVQYSWIDMYGQSKRAQAQIQAGAIASLRLDLTERRVIAPVRNFQVLSCR